MNEKIGMAVANVLYPTTKDPHDNNAEALWAVISDTEKHLCFSIARAVLMEIRKPSQQMLSAAESEIDALLASINQRDASNTGSSDIIVTAFSSMIDEVIQSSQNK